MFRNPDRKVSSQFAPADLGKFLPERCIDFTVAGRVMLPAMLLLKDRYAFYFSTPILNHFCFIFQF